MTPSFKLYKCLSKFLIRVSIVLIFKNVQLIPEWIVLSGREVVSDPDPLTGDPADPQHQHQHHQLGHPSENGLNFQLTAFKRAALIENVPPPPPSYERERPWTNAVSLRNYHYLALCAPADGRQEGVVKCTTVYVGGGEGVQFTLWTP